MGVKIHWSHVRVILGQPIFVMINGEKMSSNKCYFTNLEKVERYPDPEINRIAIGQVDGNKVVIGINSEVGTTGIFFYPNCILTESFRESHGLTSSSFKSGRVKVARFKGEWSEGLFLPMTKEEVAILFGETFEIGDSLPEHPDVYKVYTPEIKNNGTQSNQTNVKFKRGVLPEFPMHFDTEQFRSSIKEVERLFNSEYTLSISIKVHGTSARTGHVRVPKDFTWYEKAKIKFMKLFHYDWPKYVRELEERNFFIPGDYQIVNGSRRVILTERKKEQDSGYHSASFRDRSSYFKEILEKDIVVFYEVVGWENEDTPIMAKGPNGFYDYGISKGEFAIQVYRITKNGIDLPVEEMEEYALSVLNLAPVYRPVGMYNINNDSFGSVMGIITEQFEKSAKVPCLGYIDQECNARLTHYTHVNEGIVIRMDPPPMVADTQPPKFFKLKRPEFYEEEGKIKAAELSKLSLEQE